MPSVEYLKQAHCVYHTRYHLLFVTKYRREVLTEGMVSYCVKVLEGISASKYPDLKLVSANTDKDHVHLLISIPPKYAVSDVVRILKTNSARAMKQRFPFLNNMYEHNNLSFWADGYFVSTIGADDRIIKKYIDEQGREDKGQTQFVW